MKRLIYSCFVIIAAAFASCENEPLEGEFLVDDPNNPSGSFQVEIDGELFVADQVESGTANAGLQIMAIQGEQMINMRILDPSLGDHDLSEDSSDFINYTPGVTSQTIYDNISGTITITEVDNENQTVSGTFHAVLQEFSEEDGATVQFTNGVFEDLSFASPETPEPSAVFEAELDGELFTGNIVEAEINQDGFQIAAESGNEAMAITIFNPEIGTFDLADGDDGAIFYSPNIQNEELAFVSVSGTLTITEIDYDNGLISGTFSGTLNEFLEEADPIQVTNGIFTNIPFSQEEPTDTATALIDGEEFDANFFITVESGNLISLNFQTDFDDNLVLNIPMDQMEAGEYPVGGLGQPFSASYTTVDGDNYTSIPDSGNISITSYENGILSGTFNFDASPFGSDTPVISVTEGEFSMDLN